MYSRAPWACSKPKRVLRMATDQGCMDTSCLHFFRILRMLLPLTRENYCIYVCYFLYLLTSTVEYIRVYRSNGSNDSITWIQLNHRGMLFCVVQLKITHHFMTCFLNTCTGKEIKRPCNELYLL